MSKGLLNNFDIKGNFWKSNSQLELPEVFSEFKKSDKSKDKEESSKVMWAIALLLDPDSKFRRLKLSDRKNLIAKDMLKFDKFDWNKYKVLMEFYEKLILTPAERQLLIWEQKLDEKTQFMSDTTYDENNAELLEKLLGSNSKLFSELERIKEQLDKEGETGITKGGAEESASEKGEI